VNAGLLDDRVDRYLDMGSVRRLIADESRGRTAERKDGSGRSADYQFRRRPQAEARGHCHQVRKRVGLHLAHDLTSVRLDGDLADAEFAADLFVQQAGNDQCHHLAFARSQ
jgi:hypothetical protein